MPAVWLRGNSLSSLLVLWSAIGGGGKCTVDSILIGDSGYSTWYIRALNSTTVLLGAVLPSEDLKTISRRGRSTKLGWD